MLIKLSLDFDSLHLPDFLITTDRYFIVSSSFEFDDVPTVKHTEDDYYETTEKQCVGVYNYLIAICDNLDDAISYRDRCRADYEECLNPYDKSEEYSYTRYNVFKYNESEEVFEVV